MAIITNLRKAQPSYYFDADSYHISSPKAQEPKKELCPLCGSEGSFSMIDTKSYGILIVWECSLSLEKNPVCDYSKVLV